MLFSVNVLATGCDVTPSMENRGKRLLAAKTRRGFVERRELAQKSREEKRRDGTEIDTRTDESLAIPAISSKFIRESSMVFLSMCHSLRLIVRLLSGDIHFLIFFVAITVDILIH